MDEGMLFIYFPMINMSNYIILRYDEKYVH